MTLARTWAVALTGIDGHLVEVEADLSNQTPEFRIIGLADRALSEAAQRVNNAAANSGLALPRRRLTVNLSPANLPKHGSGFDVAIAMASLATEGEWNTGSLTSTAHIGELGLDGRLRPVPGILPAVVTAMRAGLRRVVVPEASVAEANLVDGIEVRGATSLAAVAALHGADVEVPDVSPAARASEVLPSPASVDLSEVVGQSDAVDALIVAAVGGHHVLMSGPPGAGKTMLARRLPGILPDMDDDAALTSASIRSLDGHAIRTLSRTPPFEAPHHSASVAALVGGGSRFVRPGAIARASGGVLFLDEAGEFQTSALDALRQPLETGSIEIHRAGFSAAFPASFQLVLATNPCPCGNYGVRGATCVCTPNSIRRYLGRLSGPLLDRIDIELHVTRVALAERAAGAIRTTTADARSRVAAARLRSVERLAGTPWRLNAHVSGAWLRDGPSAPSAPVREPLDRALHRGFLTLRGYDRVLRVAWSLADLAGRHNLTIDDVGRALVLKRGAVD